MNSKYIFIFVMTLVVGSSFIVYLNSESDVEFLSTPETTTSTQKITTTSSTSSTVAPTTTTSSTSTTVALTTTTSSTSTTVAPTTTTTSQTSTTVSQSTGAIGDEESVQIVDNNEETPNPYEGEFLNFVGFEGDNQNKLDEFVLSMPQLLQDVLQDKVIYVNGCHDYAKSLVERCPYGVWDSSGTNSDGSKGADWSMSIWVSNRAFDAQKAEDVLIHESSHALSYITRNCNTLENQSYRLDAWAYFGGEEKFADALVLYFGGSYNHYRDSGELSNEENSYLKDYLEACTNS